MLGSLFALASPEGAFREEPFLYQKPEAGLTPAGASAAKLETEKATLTLQPVRCSPTCLAEFHRCFEYRRSYAFCRKEVRRAGARTCGLCETESGSNAEPAPSCVPLIVRVCLDPDRLTRARPASRRLAACLAVQAAGRLAAWRV